MNRSTPGPCWMTITAGKARPRLGMPTYRRIGEPSTSIRSHCPMPRLLRTTGRERPGGGTGEPPAGPRLSRAQDRGPAACPDNEPGSWVTALGGFARHQAKCQPDDAPYEPGGVLSMPDSSSGSLLDARAAPHPPSIQAKPRAPLLVKRQRVEMAPPSGPA